MEAVANPHRGEVSLTLDGRSRVLRPSFGAMVALEEAMGMTIPDLSLAVFKEGVVRLSAAQTRQIIAASLVKQAGDDVAAMIPDEGFVAAAQACSKLLVNMVTGGKAPSDDAPGERVAG